MASFIKTDTHLTLVFDDGDTTTVYNNNDNYSAVCAAVKNKDWELAKQLAQPIEVVKQSIKGIDKVAVEGGFVTYDGVPLHNTLTERMLDMLNNGFDISPMAIFLENLMLNPSFRAVNELYDFLEKSELPITEDGHFLAYKRVRSDFKDIYTGKVDNSPGEVVEMPRNMVDEDKDRTCSEGLHFCSRKYLPYYGGYSENNTVVMVKINPADVVSIPSDYDNAKGRCCKYSVVKELPTELDKDNMPTEIEASFHDTRVPVSEIMVEQLNLAETLVDDGEPTIIATFDSATEAMHELDIDSSSITKACNGERRSAGGFAWRWAMNNPNNYLKNDEENDEENDWNDGYFDDD